jgi:hypothetical protein
MQEEKIGSLLIFGKFNLDYCVCTIYHLLSFFLLSQVKELGLLGMNCECLAQDAQKLFDVYWYLSSPGSPVVPNPWPSQFAPLFNMESPAKINFGPNPGSAFWSVSE